MSDIVKNYQAGKETGKYNQYWRKKWTENKVGQTQILELADNDI